MDVPLSAYTGRSGRCWEVEIILYLSAALAAVAFFILVIYLARTLTSLKGTLNNVSKTLENLEQHIEGVSRETTELLHKTNALADDLHGKSRRLNTVVDAVKDVGESVKKFNQSIQKITASVNSQMEKNEEKVSQIIQWSQVILELKDKWQARKTAKGKSEHGEKKLQKGAGN